MRRVLRCGGHLIALGPNLRFLGGKYWDFWDHYTEITDLLLVEVLENLDFADRGSIPEVPAVHDTFVPPEVGTARTPLSPFPDRVEIMGSSS